MAGHSDAVAAANTKHLITSGVVFREGLVVPPWALAGETQQRLYMQCHPSRPPPSSYRAVRVDRSQAHDDCRVRRCWTPQMETTRCWETASAADEQSSGKATRTRHTRGPRRPQWLPPRHLQTRHCSTPRVVMERRHPGLVVRLEALLTTSASPPRRDKGWAAMIVPKK